MYDIDLNRYTEVVDSAIALRPQIEKAVDEICAQGYSNLFFIGCGGTYAHSADDVLAGVDDQQGRGARCHRCRVHGHGA